MKRSCKIQYLLLPVRASPCLRNLAAAAAAAAAGGSCDAVADGADGGGDGVQQNEGFVMTGWVGGTLGALPSLTPPLQAQGAGRR